MVAEPVTKTPGVTAVEEDGVAGLAPLRIMFPAPEERTPAKWMPWMLPFANPVGYEFESEVLPEARTMSPPADLSSEVSAIKIRPPF